MTADGLPPLGGVLVLDLSRMLPGAVLARQLIDLGARLIKLEEPGEGDPMRMAGDLYDRGRGRCVVLTIDRYYVRRPWLQ